MRIKGSQIICPSGLNDHCYTNLLYHAAHIHTNHLREPASIDGIGRKIPMGAYLTTNASYTCIIPPLQVLHATCNRDYSYISICPPSLTLTTPAMPLVILAHQKPLSGRDHPASLPNSPIHSRTVSTMTLAIPCRLFFPAAPGIPLGSSLPIVGNTLSLADRETKRENGTSQTHSPK